VVHVERRGRLTSSAERMKNVRRGRGVKRGEEEERGRGDA
jgi:hypothetical protein